MSALFLRHEGFLGAVGAFLKVHPMHVPSNIRSGAHAGTEAGSGTARTDNRKLNESVSSKVRCGVIMLACSWFQWVFGQGLCWCRLQWLWCVSGSAEASSVTKRAVSMKRCNTATLSAAAS